jgi:hypothetical protein
VDAVLRPHRREVGLHPDATIVGRYAAAAAEVRKCGSAARTFRARRSTISPIRG